MSTPVPAPECEIEPVPLTVLPTMDVPEASVNNKLAALSAKAKVLPAAPKEPPVPMAKVLPALTVVAPANALLLPVRVRVPAPA